MALRSALLRRLIPDCPTGPMLVLLLLVFLKQVGNGMVWSVIALYGQTLGAGTTMIGLMISCYGGARLLANMPSGYASEKFGRRIMMSGGCAILVFASFGVVLTTQIEAFFVGLMIMGVASASFMTSALAAVADLGTPGRRLQDASFYQAANMTGTSLGPALGGIVAGLWGFGAPFFINGLVALGGVVAFALMPWPAERKVVKVAPVKGDLRAMAQQGAGVGLMYFGIFYARTASNWILMPLIAQSRFGMDAGMIGLLLTAGALANLGVLGLTAPLSRAFGRVGAIIISSFCTLAACALLAFGDHIIFLWLTSMLFGAGAGIATPTLIAYVADVAPEGQRGIAMGMLRTTQDLALILGPFCTGLLSDTLGLGYQGGLLGSLLLLSAATLVFWRGARNVTL